MLVSGVCGDHDDFHQSNAKPLTNRLYGTIDVSINAWNGLIYGAACIRFVMVCRFFVLVLSKTLWWNATDDDALKQIKNKQ